MLPADLATVLPRAAEAAGGEGTTAAQIVALLAAAAAVAGVSARVGASSPLVLTVVGICASYLPGVPAYRLSPELVLAGFLPPLLYATAIRTPFVDINRNRRAIALLSVALVLVTAFAVAGVALLLLPGLPVAGAVALGAIVAPPDAVAATAVARRVGMPRRIVTILEGESLLNDATALVTFSTARAALAGAGAVTLVGATGSFLRAVGLGVVVGLAVALLVVLVRRHVDDPVLDTTLSLVTPFATYLAAEEVHGSGVLAVVVAGLVLGHKSPEIQSAASRVTERTIWRSVTFLLESVVFLLIGLQLRGLLERAGGSVVDNRQIALLCAGVVATVVVVRVLWVFPATYLPRLVPAVARADPSPPWQNIAVLSWAGMRGVVTLAAVFALLGDGAATSALPPGMGDALALAAFAVVAATLLLQGSTLPWLVRRLGVRGPDPRQDALQQALVLQHAVDAGRHRLAQEAGDAPRDVVAGLDSWSERLSHAVWERLGSDGPGEAPSRAFRRLRVSMLDAERSVVVHAYRSGKVPGDVLAEVMERLDQEEAMVGGLGAEPVVPQEALLTPSTGGPQCDHLLSEPLDTVPGQTDECVDCVAIGERDWVHLRMCLRCGHVACCDSSPRRHAQTHFDGTRHPVMRSVELGEGWRWCFVDSLTG